MLLKIFSIIDTYLKLILTSWPAVILILFLFILLRHKDAVNKFIDRIKSIGPQGVDAGPAVAEQKEVSFKPLIEEINRLHSDLQKEAKKRFFERIYGVIFGSQLSILTKLNLIPSGITIAEASQFYLEASTKYPLLKNYPFIDYLNFLRNAGFVSLPLLGDSEGKIVITNEGKDFLSYLMTESLNFNKGL